VPIGLHGCDGEPAEWVVPKGTSGQYEKWPCGGRLRLRRQAGGLLKPSKEIKMIKLGLVGSTCYCDYPTPYAMGFQDAGSNWMYAIIDLHDHIIFFLIII
jgi:hypothetical protein